MQPCCWLWSLSLPFFYSHSFLISSFSWLYLVPFFLHFIFVPYNRHWHYIFFLNIAPLAGVDLFGLRVLAAFFFPFTCDLGYFSRVVLCISKHVYISRWYVCINVCVCVCGINARNVNRKIVREKSLVQRIGCSVDIYGFQVSSKPRNWHSNLESEASRWSMTAMHTHTHRYQHSRSIHMSHIYIEICCWLTQGSLNERFLWMLIASAFNVHK